MISNNSDLACLLDMLQSPHSGSLLHLEVSFGTRKIVSEDGREVFGITDSGIPILAEKYLHQDSQIQQKHYDRVYGRYIENLNYPHTQEYTSFIDRALLSTVPDGSLGRVAEVCCGRGEALLLIKDRIELGIGIDISVSMLEVARAHLPQRHLQFVHGDATRIPLRNATVDNVFIFGGIHHVPDRIRLFSEIQRILKPGGFFYFREPCDDFLLWRIIRWPIYQLSPALDEETERPLRFIETAPVVREAGLSLLKWRTIGFVGFCLFMNSDILVFNRLFRYAPGIRAITRAFTRFDERVINLPGMSRIGLQVIGVAQKPVPSAG